MLGHHARGTRARWGMGGGSVVVGRWVGRGWVRRAQTAECHIQSGRRRTVIGFTRSASDHKLGGQLPYEIYGVWTRRTSPVDVM